MKLNRFLTFFSVAVTIALIFSFSSKKETRNFEFKQITVIESVVPGGIGRSRMITTSTDGSLNEVKLKNFFSLTGINFGNVRENDKTITNEITSLYDQGWELADVTSGVYSEATVDGPGAGIFITRYLLKKAL